MSNIKICKYYKHPKICTADKINCFCRLHKDMCCNNLYYSMALEQKADKYKQTLNKIEARIQLENADDCLLDIMEIIENIKEI